MVHFVEVYNNGSTLKEQSIQQQALYTQQWSSQCRPMSIILNSTSPQILLFYQDL